MSRIEQFINQLLEHNIELHSCILKKGDKTIYQQTAIPYTLSQPQMLFSISKSFVSLAIGYLLEEKRIRLDESVLTFFPEYFLKADERLKKMKVVHLLTMTSGSFEEQTIFSQKNWIEAYFKQSFEKEPGCFFHYNNMDIYILSVIVTKITGISCNAYLNQKLFTPLNITKTYWDVCSQGYNTGGWGLYLSPDDLAKVAEAIVTKNPCLPLTYLEDMITKKVSMPQHVADYDQAYGYLCWMNPKQMGARFDGIFGQLVLFSCEHNAYLVITANCLNTTKLYPLVFSLWEDTLNQDIDTSDLLLPAFQPPFMMIPNHLEQFDNSTFSLRSLVSLLPIPIRFLEKQDGSATHFKWVVNKHVLSLHWHEHHTTNIIKIGLDERYRFSKILLYEKQFDLAAVGWFESRDIFVVKIVFLEYPYSRLLKFNLLSPKKILLQFEENPSVIEILDQYAYMLTFTPFVQINAWIIEKSLHLISPSVTALKRK